MIVTSRAPVRIDFAGGWTDVNIFARGAGGAVVNATIDHYVSGRLEMMEESQTGADPSAEGISVSYQSDLPAGSGLGTSAALNVVWLSLVKSQVTTDDDRAQIAELAYQLEEMLGILGGKQDQYASALGGFNYMTFGEDVSVERLPVAEGIVELLEERLVLCYTGKPRLSSNIHENVWGAFRKGAPKTVNALYALRECAVQARDALVTGNIAELARALDRNWENQRALDPSVSNSQIESLFKSARDAGAIGGKACGAGGGGCLMFCAEAGTKDSVSHAVSRSGARVIPFRFEMSGLQVERSGG